MLESPLEDDQVDRPDVYGGRSPQLTGTNSRTLDHPDPSAGPHRDAATRSAWLMHRSHRSIDHTATIPVRDGDHASPERSRAIACPRDLRSDLRDRPPD